MFYKDGLKGKILGKFDLTKKTISDVTQTL